MSKIQEELNMEGKTAFASRYYCFKVLEEDVNYEHVSRTAEENEFDTIVTTLEQLLLDPSFQEMQNRFGERHCGKMLFYLFSSILFNSACSQRFLRKLKKIS
jgi:hypothetical protein